MSLKGPLLCIKQGFCSPGKFLFYYEHYYCSYSIETFTFTGLCLEVILFIQHATGRNFLAIANNKSGPISILIKAACGLWRHTTPLVTIKAQRKRKNKVSNNSAASMEGSS